MLDEPEGIEEIIKWIFFIKKISETYLPWSRNLSGLKASGSIKLSGSFIIAAIFTIKSDPVGKLNFLIFVGFKDWCIMVAGATKECLWTSAIAACKRCSIISGTAT